MRNIIIGCGNLGSGLAQNLIRKGHTVTHLRITVIGNLVPEVRNSFRMYSKLNDFQQ